MWLPGCCEVSCCVCVLFDRSDVLDCRENIPNVMKFQKGWRDGCAGGLFPTDGDCGCEFSDELIDGDCICDDGWLSDCVDVGWSVDVEVGGGGGELFDSLCSDCVSESVET